MTEDRLYQLVCRMCGSFSSANQASKAIPFWDIRVKTGQIWKDRGIGYWLYIEQARADMPGEPYRQRIYNVRARDDGDFESVVYEIPDEDKYIGAAENPALVDDLSPENLMRREGCEVVLGYEDGIFSGSTVGQACKSSLMGASFATSEVKITGAGMTTLDRGYDAESKQVWGSYLGGYVFDKLCDYPVVRLPSG